MANKAVGLFMDTKVQGKWTSVPAPQSRLQNLKLGTYRIRWYEGGRARYLNVGREADKALAALSRKRKELEARSAGIAIVINDVPFQNMLYIADGPSDVPCFSVVGHSGDRTYAVYRAKSDAEFQKAYDLQKQHRVEAFGEADYSDGSHTAMWITKAVEDIAQRIVRDRTRMVGDELGRPPGHVLEPTPSARTVVNSEAGNLPKIAAVADDSSAPKKVPARVEAGLKQESSDAVIR